MSNPRITYTPLPNATPEGELNALAAVYRLILDSKTERGRLPDKSGLGDAKGLENDRAKTSIHE